MTGQWMDGSNRRQPARGTGLGRTALLAGVVLASVSGTPALAREGGDTDAMETALAAGYKATFTCSALFNAGRDLDTVSANELTRIYPTYRERLAGLPDAEVDRGRKIVTVAWSEDLPPRVAAWRPVFGCSQLPIAARVGMAARLPRYRGTIPEDPGPESGTALSPSAAPVAVADQKRLDAVVADAFLPAKYSDEVKTSDLVIVRKGTAVTGRYVTDPARPDAVVSEASAVDPFRDGIKTSGVVIVRNGTIVAERYAHGITAETSQRTWSVAKSISASVIGAAVHQGLIVPEDPAALTQWSSPGDPRGNITLTHLLHMASGLDSGTRGSRTDRLYFGGGRVIDLAATKSLEVAPGTRFKYSNNDTVLAMRALRERMADDTAYHAFPYQSLLWKIGARRTVLETDWNADLLSSSQIWTIARDLARLGQLYLQDGVWDGERLLAEGWASFVATPAPAQPADGWGYGAQFWLPNGDDGLPSDAYMAVGHRGQYIVIIPSRNTVIIRRGFDASSGPRFKITRFAADVLAALGPAK